MALRNRVEQVNPGSAPSAASANITFLAGSSPTVQENQNIVKHTKITVPTFTFTTTTANKEIGQKIYTFSAGRILILGCSIDCTLTAGAATSSVAGEVGLGTVIGSGTNADLDAAATHEDIMGGTTIANMVASTPLAIAVANMPGAGTYNETTAFPLNGTTTNIPVHFNIGSAYTGTGGVTVSNLVVNIHWLNLGDV